MSGYRVPADPAAARKVLLSTLEGPVPVGPTFSGWTLVQQRLDATGSVFDKEWAEYENEFGSETSNYWMGLKKMSQLTTSEPHRLRIDMYAPVLKHWVSTEYEMFVIDPVTKQYTIHVSAVETKIPGNAGNVFNLKNEGKSNWVVNNMPFSTPKHPGSDSDKCATDYKGGWWFNDCYACNLNSPLSSKNDITAYNAGFTCLINGSDYILQQSRMLMQATGAKPISAPSPPANPEKKIPPPPNVKGWQIMQQRFDTTGSSFNKQWTEYVNGFGDQASNYWMGLGKLANLTETNHYRLRLDMYFPDLGVWLWVQYNTFTVDVAAHDYAMTIDTASGSAGNVLSLPSNAGLVGRSQNGAPFSTSDRDNNHKKCTATYTGGWWYSSSDSCYACNLNSMLKSSAPAGQRGFECYVFYKGKWQWQTMERSIMRIQQRAEKRRR